MKEIQPIPDTVNEVVLRLSVKGFCKESIEIFYIQPYRAGFYYYSPVDYQGGLQYAELEENKNE